MFFINIITYRPHEVTSENLDLNIVMATQYAFRISEKFRC